MQLTVLPGRFTICRLPPDLSPPTWVWQGNFCSVTRTAAELSIVTAESNIPEDTLFAIHAGWRVLSVHGPLNLEMTGVLAALTEPLADAGVNIFSVSTFDTDHILVPDDKLQEALAALRMAGNTIV